MVEVPQSETLAAFAVRLGFKRSYVKLLRDQGRLVMSDDGKQVLVAESIDRIEATRDPSNLPRLDETTEETLTAFAARLNYKPSYITSLKQQGRLVMTEDGKRVLVQASIARIKETATPSHQAVADRHAAARAAPLPTDDLDDEPDTLPPPSSPEQAKYQSSRAEREHWNAQAAKRDYELSMRQLLRADEVEGAIASAVTQLRARLETLPDILAPQLAAEPDESKCRTLLADEIEHTLGELARAFGTIVRGEDLN